MYTIYTQDLCGYCTLAKQFLRRNGYKTVPQIFVRGFIEDTQIYVGDYEKLKESI